MKVGHTDTSVVFSEEQAMLAQKNDPIAKRTSRPHYREYQNMALRKILLMHLVST
jgi:hypothetical protein